MRAKAIPLLALLAVTTACSYMKDRANDLLDVFWLDVDAGLLASAELRVTDLCAVGAGFSLQRWPMLNVHGRYVGHVERASGGLPVYWSIGLYRDAEMVPALAGSPDYDVALQPPPTNYLLFLPGEFLVDRRDGTRYRMDRRGLRIADCGVAVAAGVGVRVGFSPGHLLDFLLGWFGLDLAGDDVFSAVGEVGSRQAPPSSSSAIGRGAVSPEREMSEL